MAWGFQCGPGAGSASASGTSVATPKPHTSSSIPAPVGLIKTAVQNAQLVKDETPAGPEMSRAVDGSLEALRLESHEALVIGHGDTRHPQVNVTANGIDPLAG